MSVSNILSRVASLISTLSRTTAAQKTILELNKDYPIIAKGIKDGLKISDTLSQAQSLQSDVNKFERIIPGVEDEVDIVLDIQNEITKAKENYNKLKSKRYGRTYSRSSKTIKAKINSNIRVAKAILDQLESDQDDAYADFIRASNPIGKKSIQILKKHTKLKEAIKKSKTKPKKRTSSRSSSRRGSSSRPRTTRSRSSTRRSSRTRR